MITDYENDLIALHDEIETGGARPKAIDAALNALLQNGGDRLAGDLLALLSDRAESDEGMFSLIHAAESFDDTRYVQALLSVFLELASSSPRWASIVLMRVMNNASAQHEVVRQLRGSSAEIKGAVRQMCERINEVSPQFLSKTTPVILASESKAR